MSYGRDVEGAGSHLALLVPTGPTCHPKQGPHMGLRPALPSTRESAGLQQAIQDLGISSAENMTQSSLHGYLLQDL